MDARLNPYGALGLHEGDGVRGFVYDVETGRLREVT
jgi:hypothetical protein